MGSRKLELVDCQCTLRVTLLLSSVLESRNLKMKVVLLLFAMIVVAFGQEADEGWEETPPADPPVEESKYKTDKYGKKLMDISRSTITSLNTDINLQNHTDINLQNPMVVTVTTRSLCMADTATTDPSQHMVMIPTVIKSRPMAKNPMVTKRQLTVGMTTTDTSQPMAKNPMVTKRQLMVGTTTTDTSQPMGKIHMVTKSQLTADTITTDTSRPMATIPTVTNNQR